MNAQDIPRSNDGHAGVALLDAAAALLAKRKPDIPADFVAKLFGLAVPDDLDRYSAEALAGIAEQSWAFLAERKAGVPKIRFEPAASPPGALPCLRSSTTTCRFWSIPSSANSISAASISVYSSIRCSWSSAIPRAG